MSACDSVQKLATEKGVIMAQLSPVWLFTKDVVAAPVIGSTFLKNLYNAVDVKLTEDEIKDLEEPYTQMSILGHL